MDFSNESYVRLYTRDTTTWKRLEWDGQNVLMQILRKLDRAGVLDLEGMDPIAAVVMHTGGPTKTIEVALGRLVSLGVVVIDDDRLIFPKFIEAQEANKTDKQRQKECRERRRSLRNHDVDKLEESQNVTKCHASHALGHTVTNAVTRVTPDVTLNSAGQCNAERVSNTPSQIVTPPEGRARLKTPSFERPPVGEAPPDLPPPEPLLVARIRKEYSERYLQKYAAAAPSDNWAERELEKWCNQSSGPRGCTPAELVVKLLDGLFATKNANVIRLKHKLGCVVKNPLEFLDGVEPDVRVMPYHLRDLDAGMR
jgi:hypothetical protein